TLMHLLDPLMKTVLSYDFPGKIINTYYHPEGVKVTAQIVPLVADLPASREAGGFLSYAAKIQPTKGQRVAMERKTGVRFCSLHILPYRDPVKDTILGFMHNWLQGVLEHQLRVLWGIG
ncbi:hypothetical protein B0H12DRAFT_963261, partial [Mycena haematopus]